MKSPFTGKEMQMVYEKRTWDFRGEKYEYIHASWLCADTGERFTDDETDDAGYAQVTNQYRVKYGIPFTDEIIAVRERYGISAAKMAQILGFGINQWRHYEAGEVPSVSNGRMIRSIMSPAVFLDYVNSSKHILGEKEYDKIRNKVAENKIKENPYVEGNVINTRTGNTLYYEPHSNVYLRASRDFIDKGLNTFNMELWNRQSMTLNDYLECFQLPKLNPRTTGALEWRLEDVMKECKDLPELIFDYFEIETGEVCGYFNLEVDPKAPKYREYS